MLNLKMKSTQTPPCAGRLVILHELTVDTAHNRVRTLVRFHEVATGVAVAFNINNLHALNRRVSKRKVPERNLIRHSQTRNSSTVPAPCTASRDLRRRFAESRFLRLHQTNAMAEAIASGATMPIQLTLTSRRTYRFASAKITASSSSGATESRMLSSREKMQHKG